MVQQSQFLRMCFFRRSPAGLAERRTQILRLLGSFCLAMSLTLPQSSFGAEPVGTFAGTVVTTSGEVLAKAPSPPGPGKTKVTSRVLKPGDQIREGETISTGSEGKVKILLADKTIIDLNPSGEFKVSEFKANQGNDRQVDLQVSFGSVRTAVNKPITGKGKFLVRTKSATMGVRGTEFVIRADKPTPGAGQQIPKTEVTVLQGRVDVSQGALGKAMSGQNLKPVSLTAGAQISTSSSGTLPAKPVMLSAIQLGSISKASAVQDNTFVKAINIDVANKESGGGQNQNRSPSGGSGPASAATSASSGAGEATKAVISQTLAINVPSMVNQAPTSPTSVGNSGFLGTFGTASTLTTQPTQVRPGGIKTVTVVITQ
jgi:hypothetical protein